MKNVKTGSLEGQKSGPVHCVAPETLIPLAPFLPVYWRLVFMKPPSVLSSTSLCSALKQGEDSQMQVLPSACQNLEPPSLKKSDAGRCSGTQDNVHIHANIGAMMAFP